MIKFIVFIISVIESPDIFIDKFGLIEVTYVTIGLFLRLLHFSNNSFLSI